MPVVATPILVKNTQAGPSVFTDPITGVQIEWKGTGDPDGEDIQQCPADLVNNVAFRKAIQRGVFEVVEATDEVMAALDRQTESWRARQEADAQASVDAIDQQANNDIVQVSCVGPGPRGTGECGNPVPVREKKKADAPPLCSQHASLSSQYIYTETDEDDPETGKAKVRWQRMTSDTRAQ